jgi:hypothetical protein
VIGLLFVFKFLLCNKLDDISKLDFSEVRTIEYAVTEIINVVQFVAKKKFKNKQKSDHK